MHPACYPFAAIVGQDEMKLALILNVIDRSIGGVVMMGHRGTGKSTVVRSLADLLPPMTFVAGCVYGCDPDDGPALCYECRRAVSSGAKLKRERRAHPVVELPLGATEDRVCGTIDIEQALSSGFKRFEAGLLARANRGFLYIDEVNLLEDHLVDLLLDVATTGVNKVERESISIEHAARFALMGSGNPEEGELRPQLLDRFGLYVEVKTEGDPERRVEIVERRDGFERDGMAFHARFADEQQQLRKKIARAQKNLQNVKVERSVLNVIARLCSDLKIDGHRGELTIMRAARALAAFEGRKRIGQMDVRRVAVMALRHRVRRDGLDEAGSSEQIEQALEKVSATTGRNDNNGNNSGEGINDQLAPTPAKKQAIAARISAPAGARSAAPQGTLAGDTKVSDSSPPVAGQRTSQLEPTKSGNKRVSAPSRLHGSRPSKLAKAVYGRERGRYSRSVSSTKPNSRLALDATLRASLTSSVSPSTIGQNTARVISPDALRFKLFKQKQGRLFIFAIDLSGSMALNRIAQVRGTMMALLRQSYLKRDNVAIVGFSGGSSELLLAPSRSILRAKRVLDSFRVGGGTPLSAGLARVLQLAKRTRARHGELRLLLFTDGRANVPLRENASADRTERSRLIELEVKLLGDELNRAGLRTILIDTQNQFTRNDSAPVLALALGAEYQRLLLDGAISPLAGWQE
ncbi:MAG: magnesium chelatase ATPase subunit I [Acidobacteriota bacterium]